LEEYIMDIEITGLAKTYRGGVAALDGVDLSIPTGMYGLLGANGAGKTTLMRILAGVLPASAGSVRIGEHDLASRAGRTAVKRTLGYLPQELGVYPDLSAREFLDYIALLKGIEHRAQRRAKTAEMLELVGLAEVAGRKLKGFSGGMKRRVGIAQALLAEPELLIVDEPTAGLDPQERIRFRSLLAGLAAERTVLLSTHIVDDIAQTCSRLAVLAAGRVVFAGATDELTAAARGKVWTLFTSGQTPTSGIVAGALQQPGGIAYRIVAGALPDPGATPAEPTLEDGYLALVGAPETPATSAHRSRQRRAIAESIATNPKPNQPDMQGKPL
jgi:ABC-type multidrug transport system ATPase subunit